MIFVGWRRQEKEMLLKASDQGGGMEGVSLKKLGHVGEKGVSPHFKACLNMERGFGFAKYQYTTCHPHAHSPRPEVLQEVLVQLLGYKHNSTHSRMEHLVVTPLKGTVSKEKGWWQLSIPHSSSEPIPKAIPVVISIRPQEGSRARF